MDFPPHHHHHPHHPYLNPDPYLPLNGYNVPHQSQQYPTTADRHYLLGPDPMQRGFGGTGGYDPRRIGAPVHGDYMTTSSSTGVGMSNTLLSHHRTSSPLQELHDPPSMHNNHRLHYQTRELDDQVRDPFYSILFYSTLFYSTLFCSVLFCLFYSVCSIVPYSDRLTHSQTYWHSLNHCLSQWMREKRRVRNKRQLLYRSS